MAAPSFVDAGTGATDPMGAWAYTCQASAAAGRVFIVQILQDGTTNAAVSSVVGTNIEDLAGTDNTWTKISGPLANGTWAVGGSEEALQLIFIGRALSTSAPTISGANSTSEDLYIRSYQFTDVNTGTLITDVIENGTAGNAVNSAGTSATAAAPSVQSIGVDRLFLLFLAINDDNAAASNFTGGSGVAWEVPVAGYAESSGTDGALHINASQEATPVTDSGATVSITDSDAWGVVGFALIGTTPSVRTPHYPAIVFQDPAIV